MAIFNLTPAIYNNMPPIITMLHLYHMYLQKTYKKYVSVTLIIYLGIVLCEVIGRVDPDPDYLPRTTSFGLAVAQYYVQFALKTKCPQYFFAIAVIVSTFDPPEKLDRAELLYSI